MWPTINGMGLIRELKDFVRFFWGTPIFEKQIIFAEPIAPKGALSNETNKVHSIKSRWYSHMKSVELKQKYEIENNITYDFILVSRFDNCFLAPFEFSTYENDCFYSASWEHPHCVTGFLDYWFVGLLVYWFEGLLVCCLLH